MKEKSQTKSESFVEWFRKKSQTKAAQWWLAVYSFFESVVLPFPTDVFLALMVLANRTQAVRLVVITTLSGVFGAVVLYISTVLFYELLLEPLVIRFGIEGAVASASASIQEFTFVATFIGAFTPIPYTPVILAAGLLRADFFAFILASLFGRGLRYVIVASVTYFFGAEVLPRLTRYMSIATMTVVFVAALILLFVVKTTGVIF